MDVVLVCKYVASLRRTRLETLAVHCIGKSSLHVVDSETFDRIHCAGFLRVEPEVLAITECFKGLKGVCGDDV